MKPLVDGVDHVFVPMLDASAGFASLTRDLSLPVMWPFTSFGGFASGGVSLGSIKLEVIDSTTEVPFSRAQDPPEIQASPSGRRAPSMQRGALHLRVPRARTT